MFVGSLLLMFGILLLLKQLGVIYGDVWDYLWPLALIALGASMIFDRRRNRP